MRTAKSAFSNRLSRTPAEAQSPLYMTRREKLIKSPGLVQSLKARKNMKQVSPEHAAEVIKNYVLPLFEQKVRKSSKVKQESADSSFNLAGCKSSMAEEIFLTTKLYDKLKRSEESRQRLMKKCCQFEQNFENNFDEEKKFQMLFMESQCQLQMMALENGNLLKTINSSKGEIANVVSEKDFYKEKYYQQQEELARLREELEKARSDLDIRLFSIIIELEHNNSLLVLQHSILSEKVSGLSTAVNSLHTLKSFDSTNNELMRILFNTIKNLFKNHSNLQNDLEETTFLAQSLIKDCDLAQHLKGILLRSEETIAKPYKQLVNSLRLELDTLKSTNSDLVDKNSVLELRVFNFLQEVEKHRRNTRLSLLFTDPTEKICGNCQKVFKMMENFNWSCRHHKAKIVGNQWFCCGKVGVKAEGCLIGKHVSIEEMEEMRVEKTASVFCNVIVRQTCRNKDHNTTDCPLDPNIRTAHEPNEELKRLERNQQEKVKSKTKVLKFNRSLVFRSLSKSRKIRSEDSDISDMDLTEQFSVMFK